MWVKQSSLRPVPPYARIGQNAIDTVLTDLTESSEGPQGEVELVFDDLDEAQPALAEFLAKEFSRPQDEDCLALGYFLSLTIWLSFVQAHGHSLDIVSEDLLRETQELIAVDQALRESEPNDPIDTADVIGMEQPELMKFIHSQVEGILDRSEGALDINEVQVIYRAVLVEVLALSYAVRSPAGFPIERSEVLA
ncbi:MAG: hypothetical protein MK135_00185 [Polyangiaceae bacterium]|nr:hypothetical protein [Polyangiaceae bacterium]